MVPDLAIQTNAYSSTMPTVGTLEKGLHARIIEAMHPL
jgi:hypothetical protein